MLVVDTFLNVRAMRRRRDVRVRLVEAVQPRVSDQDREPSSLDC